jgi:hypothetical protein
MKKHLLLFLFALICNALCAQDLIVTTNNDSINCQILVIGNKPVGDKLLHFTVIRDNEVVKISLPVEQIRTSILGYYSDVEPIYVYPNIHQKKTDDYYSRFIIAIAGGYSNRFISSNRTSNEDYYKKLKNGYHYGMELNYYFNKYLGIGINYYISYFNLNATDYRDSEKIRMQQVIPTFNVRIFDKQKFGAFLFNIGVGYVDYKNECYMTFYNNGSYSLPWTVRERGIGVLCSIGYEILLSHAMSVYLQSSITSQLKTNLSFGVRLAI